MALIKCPECGKEFSDQAAACPNCGWPNPDVNQPDASQKIIRTEEKPKNIKNRRIIIGTVACVAIAGIVTFFATANMRAFASGEKQLGKKDYEAAMATFKELKDYKNSQDLYEEAMYGYGMTILEQGKYEKAVAVFAKLGGYKDSENLYQEASYQYGLYLLKNQKYKDAIDIFATVDAYQDSSDKWLEANYKLARQYEDAEKYSDAISYFTQIKEYQDSSDRIVRDQHLADVQNDHEAPTFSGISEGQQIEANYASTFNLKDYLKQNLKVSDNLDGIIDNYSINASNTSSLKDDGSISTEKPGSYDFSVMAVDEAGNKSSLQFTVHIDETVSLTPENPYGVIYKDDDYILKAVSYTKDPNDGYYELNLSITNNTNKEIVEAISTAEIAGTSLDIYEDSDLFEKPAASSTDLKYVFSIDDVTLSKIKSDNNSIMTCSFYISDADQKFYFVNIEFNVDLSLWG